jgi:hypothetical protein
MFGCCPPHSLVSDPGPGLSRRALPGVDVWPIDALQALADGRGVKIEYQTCRTVRDLQVRNHLGLVDEMKSFDDFDFDDEAAVDEDIESA